MGDLVKLVGEVVSVERVPITFDEGTLKVGNAGYAEFEPYQGSTGKPTTLNDTIFSTVPGAAVFVGKSPPYRSKNEKLGIDSDLKGRAAKRVRVRRLKSPARATRAGVPMRTHQVGAGGTIAGNLKPGGALIATVRPRMALDQASSS